MTDQTPKLIDTYQYTSEDSSVLYEKLRFEPKDFRIRRTTPDGGYAWGFAPETRRVLFNLPKVLAATECVVCEGEKDSLTCERMGLVATTNCNGANEKWTDEDGNLAEFAKPLAGKHVIVIPDTDKPGKERAETISKALAGVAASVAVVHFPHSKDLTEYLTNGGTPEELNSLIEVAQKPENAAIHAIGELIRKRGVSSAIESEKLILGAIMNGTATLGDVSVLSKGDFSQDNHSRIFGLIQSLDSKGEATDIKAVIQTLQEKEMLESIGGLSYLCDLTEDMPPIYNIDLHIQLILEKSQSRTFIASTMKAVQGLVVGGKLEDAQIEIGKAIDRVSVSSSREEMSSVIQVVGDLNEFLKKKEPGIMTGIEELDEMTYGFRGGQLVLIAARPSVGKSSLGSSICARAAVKTRKRTDIISLEVSKKNTILKIVCSLSKVSHHRVIAGRIGQEERERLERCALELAKYPLYIDDSPGWTVNRIRQHLKQQIAKKDPVQVMMIDYLTLMRDKPRGDSRKDLEIGEITRGLKLTSIEFDIPIILLSQLNREGERLGRKPELSDLRQSGDIEQDADVVILLWQDKTDQNCFMREAELNLAKQRDGATGPVSCKFVKDYATFMDTHKAMRLYEELSLGEAA